ncbi:coiled-coil domain-containing protein 66 isoform X2 [Salmo trutta]|uniref:coiled-coil domain-containing protein 66 isoform X2 n=1 Tax=Salmo trutta TaxID=8032 RepID=UPI0011326DAF|nr:coiled-coil domain-containing protein 66 isoform X2 [Salmo trutta]
MVLIRRIQIRPQNALNSKKFPEPVSEEPLRVQRKRAERRKTVPITHTVPVKNDTPMVASNHTKPKAKGSTDHNTKALAKVSSAKGHGQIATDRPPKSTVKDSLVCLTNEQLQQILSTINNSTIRSQDQDVHSQPQTGNEGNSKEDCLLNGTGREGSAAHVSGNGNSQGKREDQRWVICGQPSGLFSSLGERGMDKEALEAKRTQWRKELDQQMALKKQQKDLSRPDVTADYGPRGRVTITSKPGPGDGHMHTRMLGGPGLEDTDTLCSTQSYSSHRDLPSAIRSAFVVGEATPVEHAFSAQKKEHHRRWLQDLDRQREEDKLRHQQEKQYLSQAEDHERWAMHFDSPQMRVPLQAPVAAERGESEPLSHQRTHFGALSVAWDGASTYGGDSLGRASVDITGGFPQKASHLRTMTALLDPAQIEERERKRLKQLEHQRAIEAQVEERRRQREAEEAVRLAVEHEEERRVAQERELLQKQYQLDTQRKRHTEEQHSRKQEELYLSVQRAQEEALKDKHQQRIRELARKGHDVSKLQHSLEGEPGSSRVFNTSSGPYHYLTGREMDTLREETCSPTSLRKDMAVKTEVNSAVRPGCTYTVEALGNRSQAVQTPDIPVEYRPPLPNAKRYRREARQEAQLAQRNPPGPGAGKENVWQNDLGDGGAGDLYEAFARTDQGQRHRGGGRRPEWNTQRPSKPYVPASERYPAGLQHTRQESRLRRQMELMNMMERNTRTPHPPDPEPDLRPADPSPPHANYPAGTAQGRIRNGITGVTHAMAVPTGRVPPRSPPVPAIKHRLQNQSRGSRLPTQAHGSLQDTDRSPPPSEYIPYLRTDEVYHMDPSAPISRPSTHPQTHTDGVQCRPISPPHQKDPLLHPELLRNTERQQAILKSLSKLRQGLLQKQKELETGLNPLMIVTEDHH